MIRFGMRIRILIFIVYLFFAVVPCWAVSPPVLNTPVNGATFGYNPVAFSWSTVTGATQYQLQVSYSSSYLPVIYNSYSVPTFLNVSLSLNPSWVYYWHVRAQVAGVWSSYSASNTFTYVSSTPVNCVVSDWSQWSYSSEIACSHSSYDLTEVRTRTITTQPANGGTACPSLTEYRTTATSCVSVDCVLGDWSEWLPITNWDCQDTTQTRTEQRIKPVLIPESNGGNECGMMSETKIVTGVCDLTKVFDPNMNLFTMRYLPDCWAEIPHNLIVDGTTSVSYEGPYCFDSNTNYADSYYSYFFAACSDTVTTIVDGVQVPGYPCSVWPSSGGCVTGAATITCEGLIQSIRDSVGDPYNQPSSFRYPKKNYHGEVMYRSGDFRAVFWLFSENSCNDDIAFVRSNDVMSVSSVNQETYSYQASYHGGLPVNITQLDNIQLLVWNGSSEEYQQKGSLAAPFTLSQMVTAAGTGYRSSDLRIPQTNCIEQDWRWFGFPEFIYDCSADKKFGFEFYDSSHYYQYWDYYYGFFEVWRYPVDKNKNPSGPLELVVSSNQGFPKKGFITAPGGGDITTDVDLQSGYKYRFRVEVDGVIWQGDFDGWPCMVSEVKGSPSYIKGFTSQIEGNMFVLPKPIFNGVRWKK